MDLGLQRRERRHKLAIYNEILCAIQQEGMEEGGAKPTRIAHLSNLAYDKFLRYLDELAAKKMILRADTLSITEQGRKFLDGYDKLKDVIEGMGLE